MLLALLLLRAQEDEVEDGADGAIHEDRADQRSVHVGEGMPCRMAQRECVARVQPWA